MKAVMSDDSEAYVNAKVQSGEYFCISEVIRAGLHLLQDQDILQQIRLERLRREIAIGLEAAARGEVAPLDVEDIITRGRQRLAEKKSPNE